MTKIRKLKRKKKFNPNVNRKRLRNKLNKLPNIECKQIKESWQASKSIVKNLEQMGLAYDPNKVLKMPNVKQKLLKTAKISQHEDEESEVENSEENVEKYLHVAKSLEEEARHPRAKLFRLPNNEVQFATYMMDKYGDDYKAMVRDRKNYNQLTWRQIKAKINRLKSIPEQYAEYLVKKGEIVLDDPKPLQNPKNMKPPTLLEPVEKKTTTKLSRRKRQKNASLLQQIWQEEAVGDNDSNNKNSADKTVGDDNGDSIEKPDSLKKLQLFSDDEDNEEDDDDDKEADDDDDDISDEGDSDNASEEKQPVETKNVKSKNNVKRKSNKKLRVR